MTSQAIQTKADPLALTEDDLRAFVGPNADAYAGYLVKCQSKKKLIGSFVWTAFFFPLVWLAYRKLYLGIAILVGIVVAFVILVDLVPDLASLERSLNVGLMAGVAVAGRIFVLMRAAKTVARADEAGLSGDARKAFLAERGGTSWISALLAGILMLGFAGWIFYQTWGSTL